MVGVLSFLWLLSVIFLGGSVVFVVVRAVKKQSVKPFLISSGVSLVSSFILMAMVSSVYVPPEIPAEEVVAAAPDPAAVPLPEVEAEPSLPVETEPPASSVPLAPAVEPAQETVAISDPETPRESVDVPAKNSEAVVSKPEPKPSPEKSGISDDSPVVDVDAENEKPEVPGNAEVYKSEVIVSSKQLLDRFITNYKVSLAPQRWTVADFDSDGAVMAMADVSLKSKGTVERAMIVFTPVLSADGKMTGATPHFVSVGDVVYGDDGYCDEFFSNMQEIVDAFGSGGSE